MMLFWLPPETTKVGTRRGKTKEFSNTEIYLAAFERSVGPLQKFPVRNPNHQRETPKNTFAPPCPPPFSSRAVLNSQLHAWMRDGEVSALEEKEEEATH